MARILSLFFRFLGLKSVLFSDNNRGELRASHPDSVFGVKKVKTTKTK
jgi:hypothetical protein